MKCCHFKMTGRGKRLLLLAVFKIREFRFMRNKHNLLLKRAEVMKPVLFFFFLFFFLFFFRVKSKSLFVALGNSGTLFFPSVSLHLFSFLLTLIWSQSMTKPHGRFDQQFCSKAADICPNGEDAFFSEMLSHASCHLSEK